MKIYEDNKYNYFGLDFYVFWKIKIGYCKNVFEAYTSDPVFKRMKVPIRFTRNNYKRCLNPLESDCVFIMVIIQGLFQ